MRYSSAQYARAFEAALEGAGTDRRRRILKNFLRLLARNRQYRWLPTILRGVEQIHLERTGQRKVEIEAVDPIPASLREQIRQILGERVMLVERQNPGLLAGVKILINNELLIDASAKQQLARMFHSVTPSSRA